MAIKRGNNGVIVVTAAVIFNLLEGLLMLMQFSYFYVKCKSWDASSLTLIFLLYWAVWKLNVTYFRHLLSHVMFHITLLFIILGYRGNISLVGLFIRSSMTVWNTFWKLALSGRPCLSLPKFASILGFDPSGLKYYFKQRRMSGGVKTVRWIGWVDGLVSCILDSVLLVHIRGRGIPSSVINNTLRVEQNQLFLLLLFSHSGCVSNTPEAIRIQYWAYNEVSGFGRCIAILCQGENNFNIYYNKSGLKSLGQWFSC